MNKRIKKKQRAEILKSLTPDERLLLKLFQESDYVQFKSHNKTEEEAKKIVSIAGNPEMNLHSEVNWFEARNKRIDATAFFKRDSTQ